MFEIKSLTDSVKNGLYDNLLSSTNKKFALEIIRPPQKVYDYMKGWGSKKVVESRAERQEINRLFFEWAQRICELLKSELITIKQLLDVIPEPWRTGLVDALVRQIDQEKSSNKTDPQTTL